MSLYSQAPHLPVIDLSLHDMGDPWRDHVAAQLDWAAIEFGAFYLMGHGIEPALIDSVVESSRALFRIREAEARRPERPVRGVPALSMYGDPADYPQFAELPGFSVAVLEYVQALTGLAQKLMSSLGRALELGDSYFADRLTGNPGRELHILKGGVQDPSSLERGLWRESGLLTLTYQSGDRGPQVAHACGWIDVPVVPGRLLVTIGGMLEQVTSGRYHNPLLRRVAAHSSQVTMPFVFKPLTRDLPQPRAKDFPAVAKLSARGVTSAEGDRTVAAA
jgi:polar amino acid transport system ATP-binding protein